MTQYRYRAARPDGERIRGLISATTDGAAVAMLSERGLIPLSVASDVERPSPYRLDELAAAFSGIAALLEAGMPADRALIAAADSGRAQLKEAFGNALQRVREGASFATALDETVGMPGDAVSMLRIGEAQGQLAAASRRVAEELGRRAALRGSLREALAYPLFLAAAGAASVVVIVGFVIPKFAVLLGDAGRALPPSTRFLLALSALVHAHLFLIAGLAVSAGLLARSALQSSEIRASIDRKLLAVPGVGTIRATLASARTCRSLGALLLSRVPMLAALELARAGAGDLEIGRRLSAVRSDVNEGSRLHAAMARHQALTPSALQLVRFGEETGRLPEFLGQAAQLEDARAQRALRSMVVLLEPALIIGFGGVVAFVAAALLQAVYSVRPAGF